MRPSEYFFSPLKDFPQMNSPRWQSKTYTCAFLLCNLTCRQFYILPSTDYTNFDKEQKKVHEILLYTLQPYKDQTKVYYSIIKSLNCNFLIIFSFKNKHIPKYFVLNKIKLLPTPVVYVCVYFRITAKMAAGQKFSAWTYIAFIPAIIGVALNLLATASNCWVESFRWVRKRKWKFMCVA